MNEFVVTYMFWDLKVHMFWDLKVQTYARMVGTKGFRDVQKITIENWAEIAQAYNNNNNYDNLYGAVMRPYRYKGALQAITVGRP